MDNVDQIIERLKNVEEHAREIMKLSGTPGAAIAILHDGHLIHSENFGFRDIENGLPVNEETIFPCGSLTKAVVSAVVATFVEEGSFTWDTPVKDILPDFRTRDTTLHEHMISVDCLSHRAGMQPCNYWLGSDNNILIAEENSMDMINDLQRVAPFRNVYLYNNHGYEIAGHILAKVSGGSWAKTLHERIFEPLEMSRTGTRAFFDHGDNNAKTYGTLDDASNVEITPMLTGENTVGGPGSAMRSCIRDLVKMYANLLAAGKHQLASGETSTVGSPFKQVPYLWSPKISMSSISLYETTYALGWLRVQTPGPMEVTGINPNRLSPEVAPYLARDHPSHLVL